MGKKTSGKGQSKPAQEEASLETGKFKGIMLVHLKRKIVMLHTIPY